MIRRSQQFFESDSILLFLLMTNICRTTKLVTLSVSLLVISNHIFFHLQNSNLQHNYDFKSNSLQTNSTQTNVMLNSRDCFKVGNWDPLYIHIYRLHR